MHFNLIIQRLEKALGDNIRWIGFLFFTEALKASFHELLADSPQVKIVLNSRYLCRLGFDATTLIGCSTARIISLQD